VDGKVSTTDASAVLSNADIELWQNGSIQVGPFKAEADGSYLISDIVPGMGFSLKVSLSGSVTFYTPRFILNGVTKNVTMNLCLDRIPVPVDFTSQSFSKPHDIAFGPDGTLYVAATLNHQIWKIDTSGNATLLAGSSSNTAGFSDATGTSALFDYPYGIGVRDGYVYVADWGNHRIRRINIGSSYGEVTTFAGNSTSGHLDDTGTAARFKGPKAIAFDTAGNIYVADPSDHCIRKITSAGAVTTVAGTGTAGFSDGGPTMAQFNAPVGLVLDGAGNIYVADYYNHRIRKIEGTTNYVSTLAGSTEGWAGGDISEALFNLPRGIARDTAGNLYVGDSGNHSLYKITPQGVVTILLGTGVAGTASANPVQFDQIKGVAVDAVGNIYVADRENDCIRKFAF
jgi:sugar lactone lactonase YvrE